MANKNYSVDATEITPGVTIAVRGKVAFSHITRRYEGQALIERNKGRSFPIESPHTHLTITEAEVLCADPQNPTKEEVYVAERRYKSVKHSDEQGQRYSIDSKGNTLPVIAIPSETEPGKYEQDTSGRELASGVAVTILLRVFGSEKYRQRGLSLEQVIVNETPRYYSAGNQIDQATLAAHGVVFTQAPTPVSAEGATGTGDVPPVEESEDAQGYNLPPAPVAQQYQAPAQQQFQPQAAQHQQPQTPVQQFQAPQFQQAPAPTQTQFQPQQAGLQSPADQERMRTMQAEMEAMQNQPAQGRSPWDLENQSAPGIVYQG